MKELLSPLEEGPQYITENMSCLSFSQPSSKVLMVFTKITVHGQKGNNQTFQGIGHWF